MFWLIFAVMLWGFVHSFLASIRFKDYLRRQFGDGFMKFYRLLYNLFAAVSFVPILYLMTILPDESLYQAPSPWNYVMSAGQVIAMILLFVAVLQTDVLSFVGLRQLFEKEKKGRLIVSGFYRYVRHPLYTFGLLLLWLTPRVSVNSFIVYLALTVYILIGGYFEERKLIREFGQVYEDYRSMTPMIVPALRFGGNK